MSLLRKWFKQGSARRVARTGLLVCLFASVVSVPLFSQSDDGAGERKVVTRVEPKYPPTLERLYIGGVVKLQVDVAANGTVESAQLLGGNPILGQAAIAAVKQWKYAPGSRKTRQTERLEFDPHR
jgi:TonB family protein